MDESFDEGYNRTRLLCRRHFIVQHPYDTSGRGTSFEPSTSFARVPRRRSTSQPPRKPEHTHAARCHRPRKSIDSTHALPKAYMHQMSLDTSSGQRRRASQQMSPNGRPISQTSTPAQNRRLSNQSSQSRPLASPKMGNSLGSPRMPSMAIPHRPSRDFRRPSTNVDREALVDWVNEHLPPPYPKASALPDSFVSGEVIFLLVRGLSGIEPNPPVPPNAFARDPSGGPGVEGLFAMMDILIDAGIDTAGVTPGEVREGDTQAIARLIEAIKSWQEAK